MTGAVERRRTARISETSRQDGLTTKGRQTRQRIVATAAKLMFEQGVAGTTIEHVRAAARVSSSQIYHYFADKESLVQAVVAYQNDEIVSVHRAVFANLDSLEGLRTWRDFMVDSQRRVGGRHGCPLGTLASELTEADAQARAGVVNGFRQWEQAIRNGYDAMRARGALVPEADPDRLATATLAALEGGLLLAQVRRSTQPLEAALDTVLAYVATQTREPLGQG
ncbi:MAG: TetR/AcrR family transcriptional regulator [Actinoallomurus sp.]